MPTSNFTFLSPSFTGISNDALQAERNALLAPRTAAFYSRRVLEQVIKWMYANDAGLRRPYQDNLSALIHEQTFRDSLHRKLWEGVRLIHKMGNEAAHSDLTIKPHQSVLIVRTLHAFLVWTVRSYTDSPPDIPPFNDALIPDPRKIKQRGDARQAELAAVKDRTASEIRELESSVSTKDETILQMQDSLAATEEEIDALRKQVAELRKEREREYPGAEADISEAETRDLFIDLMLREAGWDPAGENVPEYEVTGMPNEQGIGFVDYVLWGDDGKPLAVVEAKRAMVSAKKGQRQAELYADCLEQMTGQRPVIFYTNGYETWLWDDRLYPPRSVQGFYTKDELQLMVNRRESREEIINSKPQRDICDRYYHEEAIKRIMEQYESGGRKSLVVMATGSGKTRLSVATVDILMRRNWVRRVLFLADRTALVNQAKKSFSACLPQVATARLGPGGGGGGDARLVFSTYPTMMNCIDETKSDGVKRFGVGHFDLIIIDEAHRSVYQKYRAIFEYFDAMLLGLTATPKAQVDHNTYNLFDLEDFVPTYSYELEKAVSDEYLVPFKAVSIPLQFQREGIKYDELNQQEQEEYEEKFYDDETGEMPKEIDSAAMNAWLFNTDTVDKVLAHLMEHGQKIEGGDKLGKTIVFAKNHQHAVFIQERFDANYPHLTGKFLRVIDHQITYAQSLIDDFSVATKDPFIAVSVDMLDTGIDIHEIVNLVFFKIVRSRTKFWQMIGRGTRLRPDLFGPGEHKEFFYLFDYCQNLEFFGQNPDGVEATAQESVKQKIFKRRLWLSDALTPGSGETEAQDGLAALRVDILDALHGEVRRMDVHNFIVRAHRRQVEEYAERTRWDSLSPTDQSEIIEHLSHLPTPEQEEDEEFARRFDLLLLNLQLSILTTDPLQPLYMERVKQLATALEQKRAIPSVAEQMELILEVQTEAYWENVTLPMLEQVRRKLRGLIKFIEAESGRGNVYTHFEDEIGEGVLVEGLLTQDHSLQNYRLKVERFVREHLDHITIQRLRNNEPVTPKDIEALEAILFSEDGPGSKDDFLATYGSEQPLGGLVRRIVGLERQAAKEAFAQFLNDGQYSADQITFINQIVEHVGHNGMMEPQELFASPFTDAHDQGVAGVLPDDAAAVIEVIRSINANAVGA